MGPVGKQAVSPVMVPDQTIEQVTSFKLLGVTVTDLLRWGNHVAAVTTKASKRLRFLKKLKRAGVPQSDLVYYYEVVIRSLVKYARPVWHSSLTYEQSKALEAVQRRACQIVGRGATRSDNCSALKLEQSSNMTSAANRKVV